MAAVSFSDVTSTAPIRPVFWRQWLRGLRLAFVALLLVHLHPSQRVVHYASAGHPAVLLDARGQVKERVHSSDPPLGVIEDRTFATLGELQMPSP